tara:strand:+ start:998 stop:1522 length:525 start_codon:yes stop_codon:yes gene_type:complete
MEEQQSEEKKKARKLLKPIMNGQLQEISDAWDNAEIAEEWGPLPAGKYVAEIISGELFNSATKNTPGYKLTFKVVEGEHAGRQFWNDLWLTEAAIPISKRDLGKLGMQAVEDTAIPLRHIFRCRVLLALRTDDDGSQFNRVKRFDVESVRDVEKDPFAPPDGYVTTYDADNVDI